jgi:nucleoside 2-deoxyribosyltransferase
VIRKAWGGQSTAAVPLMELVTIICGIAATVAIAQLVTVTEENGIPGSKFAPLVPLLLFVSAIVTIGRFYHGNIRHLDEEYAGGRHGKGHTDRVRVGLAGRLATDFVVIASEALILVGLAYLLLAPIQYILLNSILLLLDSIWFFFYHTSSPESSKNWVANNLLFGVTFLVMGLWLLMGHRSSQQQLIAVVIFALLVLVNTVIDVTNEFDFYFPTGLPEPVLFLAAPFTGALIQDNGSPVFDGRLKEELTQTINYFEDRYFEGKRYTVRSAHRREAFGKDKMSPTEALAKDLEWLESSGIVIAVLSGDTSPGVQMELGAALALGKPIIQVVADGVTPPYLNNAFSKKTFADERRVHVIHGDLISNLGKIEDTVEKIMSGG